MPWQPADAPAERPPEFTSGVDLSPRAFRERAFASECRRIAEREQAKAGRKRRRASRLPVGSHGREKLDTEAQKLEEHAELMLAAAGSPEGHSVADLGKVA